MTVAELIEILQGYASDLEVRGYIDVGGSTGGHGEALAGRGGDGIHCDMCGKKPIFTAADGQCICGDCYDTEIRGLSR